MFDSYLDTKKIIKKDYERNGNNSVAKKMIKILRMGQLMQKDKRKLRINIL